MAAMSLFPSKPPWVEGEKIPDDQILKIFRQSPGVSTEIYRSALLIGSRGSGKTTLLRYLKASHHGIAVHISLTADFAPITKRSGFGPLAFDLPPKLEGPLIGLATSLLALSLIERLSRKGIKAPVELIQPCLPKEFWSGKITADAKWVTNVRSRLIKAPLESFEQIDESRPLPALITGLGIASETSQGPLLLLLDRADMVLGPCLVPVFELLDQSDRFIAIVAMRPGHANHTLSEITGAVVPGDHYLLVHLGLHPRSAEWVKFVESAIIAQFESRFDTIPADLKALIIAISRDSLKVGLELVARYLARSEKTAAEELTQAIDDLRDNQLAAAQRALQAYQPNFREIVNQIRGRAIEPDHHLKGPVTLSIQPKPSDSLFEGATRLSRFIDVALRSGAVCMPEGERWVPGSHPSNVEIPPILCWQEGQEFWTPQKNETTNIAMPEADLLHRPGGPKAAPTIFVAYRMNFSESKQFRIDLERFLQSHPNLAKLTVTDGNVPAGAQWPDAIRERIKRAKAVVADVTAMRGDVLFELGFAFGLGKVIIPATSTPADPSVLPSWLGATQLGHYADEAGLRGIVSSVATHLSDPEFARPPRLPKPIPGLAVWLRDLDWNHEAFEQFQAAANRESFKAELLGDNEAPEILIRRASTANLLVVSLDGTQRDTLAHFVCGAVAARPKAVDGPRLDRIVLVIEHPDHQDDKLVPDSVRRCPDTVRIIRPEDVLRETVAFGRKYNSWLQPLSSRKKR